MPRNKFLKAVLLLFGSILAAEIPSQAQDTAIAGLKGKVQAVLTEEFTSTDGAARKPNGSTLDVYDSAGYKLQSFLYKSDGSLWAHTVFYRNGPRVFRADVIGIPDNDGTRIAPFEPHSEQTVYDAKGREIERDIYDANGVLTSKSTHSLVEQTNSTVDDWTETTNGVESTRVITETTDPHTGVSHVVGTRNGKVYLDWTVQRNPDGTQNNKAVDADGSYTEAEQTSRGGLVQQDQYDAKTRSHWYSRWDSQGHEVEKIFESPSEYARYTYSYDKAGRQTGETDYGASGNILKKSTAEYRDDSDGNWIEKKSTDWNTKSEPMQAETVTVSVRTIHYY